VNKGFTGKKKGLSHYRRTSKSTRWHYRKQKFCKKEKETSTQKKIDKKNQLEHELAASQIFSIEQVREVYGNMPIYEALSLIFDLRQKI